jgi:hypothetical protein
MCKSIGGNSFDNSKMIPILHCFQSTTIGPAFEVGSFVCVTFKQKRVHINAKFKKINKSLFAWAYSFFQGIRSVMLNYPHKNHQLQFQQLLYSKFT